MLSWVVLLAAADSSPPDQATSAFINLGAIGALALMLLWFSLGAYKDLKLQRDQERQRAERAEAALEALNREVRDQAVPVLVRVAEILARVADDQRRERR